MKKMIYKFAIMLLFLCSGISLTKAENPDSVDISLYCVETDSESGDIIEIDPHGPRIPARPLFCSISRVEGIQISGIDTAEIVSFEIIDAYGNTIALLQDEHSFIQTIFSLNGEYRIVFRLNDRSLAGWIEI